MENAAATPIRAPKRPSKISIPERASPLAKVVFKLMRETGTTYDELEHRAGVLRSTIKAWRNENRPGLETIEACLGAMGWTLCPAPKLETLPPRVQEAIAEISLEFESDDQMVGVVIQALAAWPQYARDGVAAMAERRAA